MDPRDRPAPLPDGATCTACGATVPAESISVLAHRDDVAVVELACATCGSTALGLLLASSTDGEPVLDVADEPATPRQGEAHRSVRPITEADVEAIRRDLAAWDGDLVGWLDTLERDAPRGSVADR